MSEKELIELGFEKDKLPSGRETGQWRMPWGGAIYINETDDIKSIIQRVYEIGVGRGLYDGEQIGANKLRRNLQSLLGINNTLG